MVARVVLGKRGNDTGLWVSKPGKSALTSTADDDFLVNNNRYNAQPALAGVITNPTLTYQGTTRYTSYDPVYVCKEYDGYWTGCWGWDGKWIERCNWNVYCKRGEWSAEQNDHPGVATYQSIIPHNLGYIPKCILSATIEKAGTACPNMFIDNNNIYMRYYENDVGYKAGGIVWTATKPGTIMMECTIHYTLYAQAAA